MSLDVAVALRIGTLDLDIAFAIADDEVVALLGPNGAGKTTLLRAIAGLIPIDAGHVRLDGQVLEDASTKRYVPTDQRPIGVVFQDYLLFPHLSILDNVAFGLRSRGAARAVAAEQARQWLDRMELARYARSKPTELSGGERQRVALARALATDPRLLLLDEPLAAMDATARASMRHDLKRYLGSFQGVRLIITHDPLEAVALADRLIVMENGRHVQSGSPAEVTAHPRSAYVADLVGVNLLRGEATHGSLRLPGGRIIAAAGATSGAVFAVIHPRAVAIHRMQPHGSPRNVWAGRPNGIELLGDRVRVRIAGDPPMVAEVTPAALTELDLGHGGEIWLSFKATDVAVYPA